MKSSRFLFPLVVAVLLSSLGLAQKSEQGVEPEGSDFIRKREEWFYGRRAYPLKRTPPGARLRAFGELQRMKKLETAATPAAANPWVPIGPQPISPYNDKNSGFPAASGRVTALAVDPTNRNRVYLGAAEGGVWRTADGGKTWAPLTDNQPSLAIGSIAVDPANPSTIYVGLGEENFNDDHYYGNGLLKYDATANLWTAIAGPLPCPLGPTSTADGCTHIGSIAVDSVDTPTALLVAVDEVGIYTLINGVWNAVLFVGEHGFSVTFDPKNRVAYAAIGNIFGDPKLLAGVYKSSYPFIHWAPVLEENSDVAGRIALAMAPSNPLTLYAAVQDARPATLEHLLGVWKTTDGGSSWQRLDNAPDFCAPQCSYNLVLAVDPQNENVLYAGGDYDYSKGVANQVVRTLDGGASWEAVGEGNTNNGVDVHTDTHALAFSADGSTLYVGSDGGAWSTTGVTASSIGWTDLNSTLAITQFYASGSVHPTNVNIAFGGTQDNGIDEYSGKPMWTETACGDGGMTAIDTKTPSTVYVSCASPTTSDPFILKSTLSGNPNTFVAADSNILLSGTARVDFVPPLVIDPSNTLTLYYGTNLVYRTKDGAKTWYAISGDLTTGGANSDLTAIRVAPGNSNTVYVGSNDGVVSVSTNAVATIPVWSKISPNPTPFRAISDIAVDRLSSLTAYVAYSGFSGFNGDSAGHIYKTSNGGTTWTNISSNLPNIPVNAIVIDPEIANTLYIGTDLGVFATSNGGTSWSQLGTGLPNVVVLGLTFHTPTRTLRAWTHGRSAWDINLGLALTVTLAGTGTGTVTSNPAGINCPTACSVEYPTGTKVTLTAKAASGSTFAGWSGACTGTSTCTVTMSAAQSVTATFTSFLLKVTEAGTGTGTVTSNPAGINCPTTCTAKFGKGTVVTLTATPASNSTFTGWSGACTGTSTCTVTMSTAQSVTATFTSFSLTVAEAGAGTGTVTSSPAGINCPTTCTAKFASGSVVMLTAVASPSSSFAGWGGACSGVGTCSLTMDANQSVTANFNAVTSTTTTSVASSFNPSTIGASVTFTTTVSSSGGTPSGTVTLKDGSSTLSTITLSNGQGTFTTSAFSVGKHSMTGVYGGAPGFLGSTSPVLIQTVNTAVTPKFSVLHNFGSAAGDPLSPSYQGTIAQGRDGSLYTTAGQGGSNNGAVFKVTPAGTLTVLYNFDVTHGNYPASGLTLGADGNLYGTTVFGGANSRGTIFNVTPSGSLTVLYSFPSQFDGAAPEAPPVLGTGGNWYGTASGGGLNKGTVYQLTPSGTFTALYRFSVTDGSTPIAPLVQGTDGSFYGTTPYGGANGYGEIFKITTAGALTVLHSFDGTNGAYPDFPLIQATDGNFYGTTDQTAVATGGGGVVFKVTPAGTFTVVHSMNPATEGQGPTGLVQASDGNFYGANGAGGASGNGTLFEMTLSGVLTILHTFDGTTGSGPSVTPSQNTNGILYGDTFQGGTGGSCGGGCGVFYSLNVSLPPFINLVPYSGKVGSTIGILGQGFSSSSIVKFNGVQATSVTLTGTTFLQATVPAGATSGYVTVTTGTAALPSLRKFTVN